MKFVPDQIGYYELPIIRNILDADGQPVTGEYIKEYKNGAKFEGTLYDGKRCGTGLFTWPNGSSYHGEFYNNQRNGIGEQKWADGSIYIGSYKNDMRQGHGVQTWLNGEKYDGQFFKDRKHGTGIYTWPNGSKYQGTFCSNEKEGYGTFEFADGIVFQGLYKEDNREGPGVLTYPDGRQDVGWWHKERLIRISMAVSESFSIIDYPEFEYDAAEHEKYIELGDGANSSDSKFSNIINPKPYSGDLVFPSRFPSVDIMSLKYDQSEFDREFFKEHYDNNVNVLALNQTPTLLLIQKHMLRHQPWTDSVEFSVENVKIGNRTGFGAKGPIEVASEELLYAALDGDNDTVLRLLRFKMCYVDVMDRLGNTALHLAAICSHHQVMNTLLNFGADVNRLTDEGVSALSACHVLFYDIRNFKYTLTEEHLRKYYVNQTAKLNEAEADEDEGILERLQRLRKTARRIRLQKKLKQDKEYSTVNPRDSYRNLIEEEPVAGLDSQQNESHSAGNTRSLSDSEVVIEKPEEEANEESDEEKANEHDDCPKSVFESTRSLLNYEIEVTPGMIERTATTLSENEIIQKQIHSKEQDPGTARQLAMKKIQYDSPISRMALEETIKLLLRRGSNPNASGVPIPVLFFALKSADADAVSNLLSKGASTEQRLPKEKGGFAPLHIAVTLPGEAAYEITELLLKWGAVPDVQAYPYDEEVDPMEISDLNSEKSVESVAIPDLFPDEVALDEATEESQRLALHQLNASIPRAIGVQGGRTPLDYASLRDDDHSLSRRIIAALLRKNANPNVINPIGHSPLSTCIMSGNDQAIDELLVRGACPSMELTHGNGCALAIASSTEFEHRRPAEDRLALIDKLMSAGCNIMAEVTFGIGQKKATGTSIDYAYFKYYQDKRIAFLPYHALSPNERETYNSRRELLGHMADLLRAAIIKKEYERLVQEEFEGNRSISPSEKFYYSGHGANSPDGIRSVKGLKSEDKILSERKNVLQGGILTIDSSQQMMTKDEVKKILRDGSLRIRKPLFKYCYECGRSVGVHLNPCTRCKEVFYCSKNCKLKAWNARHKEECVRLANKGSKKHISLYMQNNDKDQASSEKNQLDYKSFDRMAVTKGALVPRDISEAKLDNSRNNNISLDSTDHPSRTSTIADIRMRSDYYYCRRWADHDSSDSDDAVDVTQLEQQSALHSETSTSLDKKIVELMKFAAPPRQFRHLSEHTRCPVTKHNHNQSKNKKKVKDKEVFSLEGDDYWPCKKGNRSSPTDTISIKRLRSGKFDDSEILKSEGKERSNESRGGKSRFKNRPLFSNEETISESDSLKQSKLHNKVSEEELKILKKRDLIKRNTFRSNRDICKQHSKIIEKPKQDNNINEDNRNPKKIHNIESVEYAKAPKENTALVRRKVQQDHLKIITSNQDDISIGAESADISKSNIDVLVSNSLDAGSIIRKQGTNTKQQTSSNLIGSEELFTLGPNNRLMRYPTDRRQSEICSIKTVNNMQSGAKHYKSQKTVSRVIDIAPGHETHLIPLNSGFEQKKFQREDFSDVESFKERRHKNDQDWIRHRTPRRKNLKKSKSSKVVFKKFVEFDDNDTFDSELSQNISTNSLYAETRPASRSSRRFQKLSTRKNFLLKNYKPELLSQKYYKPGNNRKNKCEVHERNLVSPNCIEKGSAKTVRLDSNEVMTQITPSNSVSSSSFTDLSGSERCCLPVNRFNRKPISSNHKNVHYSDEMNNFEMSITSSSDNQLSLISSQDSRIQLTKQISSPRTVGTYACAIVKNGITYENTFEQPKTTRRHISYYSLSDDGYSRYGYECLSAPPPILELNSQILTEIKVQSTSEDERVQFLNEVYERMNLQWHYASRPSDRNDLNYYHREEPENLKTKLLRNFIIEVLSNLSNESMEFINHILMQNHIDFDFCQLMVNPYDVLLLVESVRRLSKINFMKIMLEFCENENTVKLAGYLISLSLCALVKHASTFVNNFITQILEGNPDKDMKTGLYRRIDSPTPATNATKHNILDILIDPPKVIGIYDNSLNMLPRREVYVKQKKEKELQIMYREDGQQLTENYSFV